MALDLYDYLTHQEGRELDKKDTLTDEEFIKWTKYLIRTMRMESELALMYAEQRRQRNECGWFNDNNLEEFFEHHGMKEVDNWVNRVNRGKWGNNFVKYIRHAFKQDWLDFIRVKKNQNDPQLYLFHNQARFDWLDRNIKANFHFEIDGKQKGGF